MPRELSLTAFQYDLGMLSDLATINYMQRTFLLSEVCYRSIVRDLSRMLKKPHALGLVVPQKGCVMQKPLLGDGLRIAPELDIPKTVVCMHAVTLGLGVKFGRTWQNMPRAWLWTHLTWVKALGANLQCWLVHYMYDSPT